MEVYQKVLAAIAIGVCLIGKSTADIQIDTGRNFDATIVSDLCNGETYEPGDIFEFVLDRVLLNLERQTAYGGYNYYGRFDGGNGLIIYGHGACNGKLSHGDCSRCMFYAVAKLQKLCERRKGAQLQLKDCRVRYEQYQFSD